MCRVKRGIYILLLLVSTGLWARGPKFASDDAHYFGISMQGGYSALHPYQVDVTSLHGFATGMTLLYEYQHNHFLLDIGGGFTWQQAGWSLNDMLQMPDQRMVDSQGDEFTLRSTVKRWDVVRRGVVDIPIMMGGEWGLGYFLGGVKVGVGVLDYSNMQGAVSTWGEYDQYFVPIHDAANHGFYTDEPIEQSSPFLANIDLRLSVEGGINMAQVQTPVGAAVKVRVGLFADYGFFFSQVDANQIVLVHQGSNLDLKTYQMHPILVSGSHWLDNLVAGVRLTVLIGAPGSNDAQRNCPSCRLLDDRWRPIRFKNKCVTCERGY